MSINILGMVQPINVTGIVEVPDVRILISILICLSLFIVQISLFGIIRGHLPLNKTTIIYTVK